MLYGILKLAITAGLIVLVSEVSKRHTGIGGLLASLPLVSYLGMIWLYVDTGDKGKVADLSWSVFWLVIPSLSLFIALPLLLKKLDFVPSLLIGTLIMFALYAAMMWALGKAGFQM